MENDVNDRNFLLAVAKQEVRQRLLEAQSQQWLLFENAGGIGSIPQRAKELAASPPDRLRSYLLFDSDARLPGRPSSQARNAASRCEEGEVSFHRLERRTIENYIPVPALKQWAYSSRPGREASQRAGRVRAYSNMVPEQRHHFNLRHGSSGDLDHPDWPLAEIETLYARVPDDDRSWLQDGLGRHIASEVFGESSLPYKWIVGEGICDELEPLLETILRKL
ncbi:MAG: hypothetical protein NTY19_27080 [Planctomycetota bacterium]|nr:hypothetical protein [Planctomycetota bacterium]